MYIFKAHYINIETEEEVTRTIEIDELLSSSEKAIYLYAMDKAYDMMERNECFDNLEFIAG